MSEKVIAHRQDPKVFTAAEIRSRVEDLAEELAQKMRIEQPGEYQDGLDAFPLDNRVFIRLMSDFVRMN